MSAFLEAIDARHLALAVREGCWHRTSVTETGRTGYAWILVLPGRATTERLPDARFKTEPGRVSHGARGVLWSPVYDGQTNDEAIVAELAVRAQMAGYTIRVPDDLNRAVLVRGRPSRRQRRVAS